MITSMCFMSMATLLMAGVRTGAILQNDVAPRRCYMCSHGANSTCEQSSSLIVECPVDRQYCATVTVAPNFTSSLQCAAAGESPCSLKYSQQALQLTCVCSGQLCNAPFSAKLLNDLVNFSSKPSRNSSADLTENFFKLHFNFTSENLYKAITVGVGTVTTESPAQNISIFTTLKISTASERTTTPHSNEINAPRAEALKQEATVPSDDDEDESEGSGSYEEIRSQRQPAAAPAAPSSHLPANENKAPPLYTRLFLTVPLLMYFIV